jgi:hypothetical protein
MNHFSFSTQTSSTLNALMNKTSNNKLDQSIRISYAEMRETLKEYEGKYDNSIHLLNESYKSLYFDEWFNLMK